MLIVQVHDSILTLIVVKQSSINVLVMHVHLELQQVNLSEYLRIRSQPVEHLLIIFSRSLSTFLVSWHLFVYYSLFIRVVKSWFPDEMKKQ